MDKSLVQQLGKIHEYRKVPKELIEQYINKLEFCGRYFDYNDENKEIKEKNDRLYYLQQISDLLQESNAYPALVLPHFEQLMIMIENNIFRPLPIQKNSKKPDFNAKRQRKFNINYINMLSSKNSMHV
ncbi:protein phosphatase 2A regulatory B subunit, B56 family protein (macronuclear) [Tetrahymena thermophila SB210]|uniref:Protein phosphatase 2A regulatory B subunit, B56 family protein n=1 Tax=Tetrahymena thermophila (strain SB210) TaxID=312017 RepID=Q235K7_TETTS|nr:protein phosphatase 2A regulatory B subunit, B56 family protein [Tetrahymena thermophila SB210]EAR92194.2 protein phosphatase 2A regulatory B subunit, B56 family protein [Tetrahymena thermophila SB210]|eukprot:XP_001012439.2 protein phosphatase 2A regulatory B subunit, B56 family protein [Tetrahymena thermophila SB210]